MVRLPFRFARRDEEDRQWHRLDRARDIQQLRSNVYRNHSKASGQRGRSTSYVQTGAAEIALGPTKTGFGRTNPGLKGPFGVTFIFGTSGVGTIGPGTIGVGTNGLFT